MEIGFSETCHNKIAAVPYLYCTQTCTMERKKLIGQLLRLFLINLNKTLKPFEKVSEKADYLEALIDYISGVYHHEDAIPHLGWEGNPFDSDGFVRKNILARFKSKVKPFLETRLQLFLEKKTEYRQQLFQMLKLNEPILNDQEFETYIRSVNELLQNLIEKVWIETSSDDEASSSDEIAGTNGYSRSRQVLMLHYLLEITKLGRNTNSLSKVTEFAHALLNIPTKNFNTSALQKMFKTAPILKVNEINMVQDLEFVKTKFMLLGSSQAVELIQTQINKIKGHQA